MLQTAGLDFLIAWAIFFALLLLLAFFLLRVPIEALEESEPEPEEAEDKDTA